MPFKESEHCLRTRASGVVLDTPTGLPSTSCIDIRGEPIEVPGAVAKEATCVNVVGENVTVSVPEGPSVQKCLRLSADTLVIAVKPVKMAHCAIV